MWPKKGYKIIMFRKVDKMWADTHILDKIMIFFRRKPEVSSVTKQELTVLVSVSNLSAVKAVEWGEAPI